MNKANMVVNTLRQEGLLTLFSKIYLKLLKIILPEVNIKRKVFLHGVPIIKEKRGKFFLTKIKADQATEAGIVFAHQQLTLPGDKVVIIGGGDGLTAVIAGKLVGNNGRVDVYEGGDRSVARIKKNIKLNGLTDVCTVHHAIVGDGIDVYGGDPVFAKHILPTNLPHCDVLELDCEGSEVSILQNLTNLPRIIIVELHPSKWTVDVNWVSDKLKCRGYIIVWRSGHNGISLSESEYHELLHLSKNDLPGSFSVSTSGAYSDIVIAGVNENYDR